MIIVFAITGWIAFIVVCVLHGYIVRTLTESSQVQDGRRNDMYLSHDKMWSGLVTAIESSHRSREEGYRDEIRSLTEAIGRSKDTVYVNYPVQPHQMEPSQGGWFDRPAEIQSVRVDVVTK